jgi:hypothetical protein
MRRGGSLWQPHVSSEAWGTVEVSWLVAQGRGGDSGAARRLFGARGRYPDIANAFRRSSESIVRHLSSLFGAAVSGRRSVAMSSEG